MRDFRDLYDSAGLTLKTLMILREDTKFYRDRKSEPLAAETAAVAMVVAVTVAAVERLER